MIIDTFLYSAEFEKHLLFTKLKLEYDYVDEFIIQENSYDLKGCFKGVCVNKILQDPIFAPFNNKITVISFNTLLYKDDQRENINFERENWQRRMCTNYILSKYNANTKVIISDTDEMFDFSGERLDRFETKFNEGYRFFSRRRYWYSFRNECKLPNLKIPVITVQDIQQNKQILGLVRHLDRPDLTYFNYHNPVAFEYSYVMYDWKDIQNKHKTYAHNDLDAEGDVKEGLRLNAWIRSKKRNEPRTEYDFFELIELTEENSPKYVRDHIGQIDTNIIDPNYKENRKHWTSDYT